MLVLVRSSRFREDMKRAKNRARQGRGSSRTVLMMLAQQAALPTECCDDTPREDSIGFRDLHIEPDWLPLHRIEGDEVRLFLGEGAVDQPVGGAVQPTVGDPLAQLGEPSIAIIKVPEHLIEEEVLGNWRKWPSAFPFVLARHDRKAPGAELW